MPKYSKFNVYGGRECGTLGKCLKREIENEAMSRDDEPMDIYARSYVRKLAEVMLVVVNELPEETQDRIAEKLGYTKDSS